MIVGKMFTEDSAEIADLQHDVYRQFVGIIFEKAKKEYIKAELTLGNRTKLGKDLKNTDGFDHRTIQWLHDAIASQFRFNYVTSKSSTQASLFDLPENIDNNFALDLVSQWKNFLISEVKAIFTDDPNMIKQVCLATTYPNPDKRGCQAEDNIYRYTLQRYERLLVKKP